MKSLIMLGGAVFLSFAQGCHSSSANPHVQNLVKPGQDLVLRPTLASSETGAVEDLVVFGDSLSDSGRLYRRSMGLYIPPDIYWQGRLSNGPNWVDYVCGAMSCRHHNYAVAGASSRLEDVPLRWVLRPLDAQVDEFLSEMPAPVSTKTLAIIWIGANNYIGKTEMQPDVVREDIKASATKLLQGPVQRLLIGNMPQLAGLLTAPTSTHEVPRESYRKVTAAHNRNIQAVIDELQGEFPTKSIALFDAYEINQATMDRPQDFAFTSLTEACYQGDYRGQFHGKPGFCTDYFGLKFWDYTHPNSRMHCYYASRFLLSLHEAGWLQNVDAEKAIDICRQL